MQTNYLKKVTIAKIGAIPANFKDLEHGAKVQLLHVFGRVDSLTRDKSQFGPYVKFKGTFKAVHLADGEVYRGNEALFPDIAADPLADAFENGEGNPVEFAVEIGLRRVVKKNDKGDEVGAGYEYTMKPLIEIDEAADPLAMLEAKAKQAALPAPKAEEKHEDEPAKSSKKK